MNSYNDNLHSTVLASLQSQELKEQAILSKANASMFSLYYAEGATITANEKLESAKKEQRNKSKVKAQAVGNSNICNNVLSSATQADAYVQQSITNASVCAANIQIATNAIVRLASDIGSIHSIVNATNADTEISALTGEALHYISTTAYEAEKASQLSMEGSIGASEVSSSTVLDKAKVTSNNMGIVMGIATNDYNKAAQLVSADNTDWSTAYANEKKTEGTFEDLEIDLISTTEALNRTRKELNLNLTAIPIPKAENTSFLVKFHKIEAPFIWPKAKTSHPVEEYNIVVVKESEKTTFSLSNAEAIVLDESELSKKETSYKSIKLSVNATSGDITTSVPGVTIVSEEKDSKNTNERKKHSISLEVKYLKANLKDSNGDFIDLGKNYVVFVMATYTPEYKKYINSYDEYLSAPSMPFCLTNKLAAVDEKSIKIPEIFKTEKKPRSGKTYSDEELSLTFSVTENPDYESNVEYRCIFLPSSDPRTVGLLNTSSFNSFVQEVKKLERIANEFDPKIAENQAVLIQQQLKLDHMIREHAGGGNSSHKSKASQEQQFTNKEITEQKDLIKDILKEIQKLKDDKEAAITQIKKTSKSPIDFMFNLELAEQVLAGNYTSAIKLNHKIKLHPASRSEKKSAAHKQDSSLESTAHFSVLISSDTTDNFGNLLVDKKVYYPVILSNCIAVEENLSKFSNALSDFSSHNKIHFHTIINSNN